MVTETDAEVGHIWFHPSTLTEIQILSVDKVLSRITFKWLNGISVGQSSTWPWTWKPYAATWEDITNTWVPGKRNITKHPHAVITISLPEQETFENGTQGMTCASCKNAYPYVEANQDDGTYKCYNCR